MNITEHGGDKVTFSFFNYWEQKHVGQVLRPYLNLKGKFQLTLNTVIPPSPYKPGNKRLVTEVQVDHLPDFLESIDDQGAKLVCEVAAGSVNANGEQQLMDHASVALRAFMGQVTTQDLQN